MSAPLVRSIGPLTIAGAQPSLTVTLPPRKVGDILFVHFLGFDFDDLNTALPEDPPGAEVLYTDQEVDSGEVLWAIRVLNANVQTLTLTGDPGFTLNWAVQTWVVTNVTPSTTWYDVEGDSTNFFGNIVPAVTVSGDDRLVIMMIRGLQFFTAPGLFAPPGGFDLHPPETSADRVGIYYQNNIISTPADASTSAAEYIHSNSSDWIFYLSIIGIDETPLPALPQPGQVRLNCAESYMAWITGADYETRVGAVGWKDIAWNRILDEPSKARVVIPDEKGGVRCCISHGGIKPWSFGLLIERNDVEVWRGPITMIGRNPSTQTTEVQAYDFLKRYEKRLAVRGDENVEWVNTDSGVAFAAMINTYARVVGEPWFVEAPTVFTGAAVTRKINPRDLTMASAVLKELVGASVDAYVANGVLYVWEPGEGWRYFDGFKRTLDGPYNVNYDMIYGIFTRDAFIDLPSWDVDGMDMANFVSIPSADTGQQGFRQIWEAEDQESQIVFGMLDHMEPNSLDLPDDAPPSQAAAVLQARANTFRDLHSMPPVVISGGSLAEGAPVDINSLRPGSIWILDIFDACYGQLRTASRLKSVNVTVSLTEDGIKETVSPTMFPPGFEGGEQNV